MRRFVVLFSLLIASWAYDAHAGSIILDWGTPLTITTTAPQDAALARLLADVNTDRATQKPPLPAWTVEQWLRSVLLDSLQSYRRQAAERDASEACIAYQTAAPATQASIKTALGGRSPCP